LADNHEEETFEEFTARYGVLVLRLFRATCMQAVTVRGLDANCFAVDRVENEFNAVNDVFELQVRSGRFAPWPRCRGARCEFVLAEDADDLDCSVTWTTLSRTILCLPRPSSPLPYARLAASTISLLLSVSLKVWCRGSDLLALSYQPIGLKYKVENKSQYEEYLRELEPIREELGISLKESMYPDNK
jgi:Cytochrome c oxidase subunit Va